MIMLPDGAEDRLMGNAQRLADACKAAGVQQWDLVGFQAYGQQVDIEAGKVTMAAGGGEGGFGVRVVQDGRFGFAHMVDVSGADAAVAQAIKIANMSPNIDGFVLPSDEHADPVSGLFDAQVLDVQPETLLAQADAIIASVAGDDERAVVTGGGLGVSATASVLMNSEGVLTSGVTTNHGLGVQVTIDVDGHLTSAYQGQSSRTLMEDVPPCVGRAVHWAQVTQNTVPSDEGAVDAPVLFTSEGMSPLFSMVVPPALTGEKLVRGESFWSGRQGEQVLANHLHVTDNGRLEGGLSSGSRDGEGVPRRVQTLVQDGVLMGALWSTRDAAQQVAEGRIDDAASTGSATAGGHQSPPGTGCTELMLTSSAPTEDWDSLLGRLDDGFVVNSVMGAHTANPTSGDFSVTTSSILRVVDGEVVGALKQAGLSGNLAQAMAGEVVLGQAVRQQGSYSSGRMHLPDVLIAEGLRINPA